MRLSSSRIAILLYVCSLALSCRGNPSEFKSLSVASSTATPLPVTHRTTWRHVKRGGSKTSTPAEAQSVQKRQIPSFFQGESDSIYDRYAACLAATEGLRRIRDETLQLQQQKSINDPLFGKKKYREAKNRATAVYAENASKVIEAMGMPVSEFNSIGKIVCNDASLKQKVLEQAYLYRLQSNVVLDEISVRNEQQLKSFLPISNAKFQMFCESMYEVEKLRRNLAEEMKQKFQLTELPSITSQAALRPLLDSEVRSAIDSFPIVASNVVHQFGLKNDEFNELLRRTKTSAVFRWKVLRNLKMIERDRMK